MSVLATITDFLQDKDLPKLTLAQGKQFLDMVESQIQSRMPVLHANKVKEVLDEIYFETDNLRDKISLQLNGNATSFEIWSEADALIDLLESMLREANLTYPDQERDMDIANGNLDVTIIYGTTFAKLQKDIHHAFLKELDDRLRDLQIDSINACESTKKRHNLDFLIKAYGLKLDKSKK